LIADLQRVVNGVRPQQVGPAVRTSALEGPWSLLVAGVTYDREIYLAPGTVLVYAIERKR